MPISPQHIAPPINSNTVGEFCKQIDDKLQNPLQVSTAIVDVIGVSANRKYVAAQSSPTTDQT
jgi:hypothetical protein